MSIIIALTNFALLASFLETGEKSSFTSQGDAMRFLAVHSAIMLNEAFKSSSFYPLKNSQGSLY